MGRRFKSNFPHVVETVAPGRGLQNKRVAMKHFHARNGIKPHASEGRYKDGAQYIRWHFADRKMAEAFAEKFAKETDVSLRP